VGVKLVSYILAATLTAATVGALLGLAGSLLPLDVRVAVATLAGLAAAGVGGAVLAGRLSKPPQCDRETPQRWIHLGPVRWALINGAALGFGGGSRLGFWLWYCAPFGAFLFGQPIIGAAVYGSYGLVRAASAFALLVAMRRTDSPEYVTDWLLARAPAARQLAASQLLVLGVTSAVVAGL
jgi:hypothetical protein